jgi:hypothetical protein
MSSDRIIALFPRDVFDFCFFVTDYRNKATHREVSEPRNMVVFSPAKRILTCFFRQRFFFVLKT